MYVPRPKTSLEGHNGPPHGYVTVRPVRLGTPCSVHVSPRKSFFLLAWMAPSPSPLPLRRSTDFRFLDAPLLGPVWTKQRKGTRRGEVDSRRLHGRWWFDDDSMIPIPAEAEEGFLSPDRSIAESVTLLDFLFVDLWIILFFERERRVSSYCILRRVHTRGVVILLLMFLHFFRRNFNGN